MLEHTCTDLFQTPECHYRDWPHTLERCAWQTIHLWSCDPADWNKLEVLHALCELRYVMNKSTSVIGVSPLSLSSFNAILFPWTDVRVDSWLLSDGLGLLI